MKHPPLHTTPRVIGRYTGDAPGPLVIAIGGMHGNEQAGVQAIIEVGRMLKQEPRVNPGFAYRGRFLGLRGNLAACRAGVRYLEKDLNRQFTPENIERVQGIDYAELQAEDRELKELLATVTEEIEAYRPDRLIVLDLHTTTADGGIFSIASDTPDSIALAKTLHAPVITGMLRGISGTTLHYFRDEHFTCPVTSVTFEAGQHQDPLSVHRAIAALINLLRSAGSVSPEDVENRHDEMLMNYSRDLPRVAELLRVHPVRPGDGFRMEEGFQNFQAVTAEQLLARDRTGPIHAEFDGLILMPLYQTQGEDGFFLIRVVEGATHVSPRNAT